MRGVLLVLIASEAVCMCTDVPSTIRRHSNVVFALPLRTLRGGRQGDGTTDLSQIRTATCQQLDEKGFIEAGLDSSEPSQPSEHLHDEYLPPVALERLERSAASAAAAPDGGGAVAQVSEILRRCASKEVQAPGKCPPHEGSTAAAPAAVDVSPTAQAAAGQESGLPHNARCAAERPVWPREVGDVEKDQDIGKLPKINALDGMMHLGGRDASNMLSWGDEDCSTRYSTDQACAHKTRPGWNYNAGDVMVPGDFASLADALAGARERGSRILLHGGRHYLGAQPLKIGGVQGAASDKVSGEVHLCGNGALNDRQSGSDSEGHLADESRTEGTSLRGRVCMSREGHHSLSDLAIRHESVIDPTLSTRQSEPLVAVHVTAGTWTFNSTALLSVKGVAVRVSRNACMLASRSLVGGEAPPPLASLPHVQPTEGRAGGCGGGGNAAGVEAQSAEKEGQGTPSDRRETGDTRDGAEAEGCFDLGLGEYVVRVSDAEETGRCEGGAGQGGLDEGALGALREYRRQLAKAQNGVELEHDALFVGQDCCIKLTGHLSGHGLCVRGRARADLTRCYLRNNRHAVFATDAAAVSLRQCVLSENDFSFWTWTAPPPCSLGGQSDGVEAVAGAEHADGGGARNRSALTPGQETEGTISTPAADGQSGAAGEVGGGGAAGAAGVSMVLEETLVVVDEVEGEAEWFDDTRPARLLDDRVDQRNSNPPPLPPPQTLTTAPVATPVEHASGAASPAQPVQRNKPCAPDRRSHAVMDVQNVILRGGDGDEAGEGAGVKVYFRPAEEEGPDESEDRRVTSTLQAAEEEGFFNELEVDKGALPQLPLQNRYFAMRHGKSEANAAGLIVSDPANGCEHYGLTPEGREQAAASGQELRAELGEELVQPGRLYVVCSDFKRTRETAEVLLEALGRAGEAPLEATWLRERFFGELELGDHRRYSDVWALDEENDEHTQFGVEPAAGVRRRTMAGLRDLERRHSGSDSGKVFVLVSHGDALQITQTAFAGIPPAKHRSLAHMNPAQVRELTARTGGEGA